MAPTERITYFAYNDGIDPSRLRLGTLAFDYANPRTARRSYVPSADFEKALKDSGLIDEDQRTFCSMLWSQKSDALLDVDLKKIVSVGGSASKSDVRLIVGSPGSRVEVTDMDRFFEDYLLKQDAVKEWFETRLSVARSLLASAKNIMSLPEIWLLTGTYVIQDGTVCSVRKETSSTHASARIPLPEPTGISELASLHLHATIRLGDGIEAQASHRIEGRKIWAAQWIKVKARYVAKSALESNANAVLNQVELQDVFSAGTTRTLDPGVAQLELSKESEQHSSSEGFDERWWSQFDKRLGRHLDDLESRN